MIKLAVIFGGESTEHEVSIVSGTSVISHLNKEKYDITPIYISKEGEWFCYTKNIEQIQVLTIHDEIKERVKIDNIVEYLKSFSVIFPVLHGKKGEDGTIQGMLEMLDIPYVGTKVLASSLGMDKAYTKIIFEQAKIQQAPYLYLQKNSLGYYLIDSQMNRKKCSLEEIVKVAKDKLTFPVFVKPSNSGSSVGIKKVQNEQQLKECIIYASNYDKKVLIEQGINGMEIECSVIGNDVITASEVGEVVPTKQFYTYDEKYSSKESKTIIPANLSDQVKQEVQRLAKKAFEAIDGRGLSRVDFFVEKDTNHVIINEINTMPGFTTISMYPKLWEASGVSYSELMDTLIELALEDKIT